MKARQNTDFGIIDITKLFLAVAVIAIHTHPLENCPITVINNLYSVLVLCAVPLFFMFSGYLLMHKILLTEGESYSAVLLPYCGKIVKLYLLWSAIYLPLAVYDDVRRQYSVGVSVLKYLQGLFLIGEHYNSWILWYLLSTVYALIFILILKRMNLKLKTITAFGLLAFLLGCFISAFVAYSGTLPPFVSLVQKGLACTVVNGRLLRGFFYLPLGMYLRKNELSKRSAIICMLVGLLLGIVGTYTVSILTEVTVPLIAAGAFSLLLRCHPAPSGKYFYCRKMSTVLYFIHLYVYSIFELFIWKEKRFGFGVFLIVTLLSALVGVLYMTLKYKPKKGNPSKP